MRSGFGLAEEPYLFLFKRKPSALALAKAKQQVFFLISPRIALPGEKEPRPVGK